eukprot:jgi/Chlat1/7084/Chrsp57S06784
MSSRPGYRPRPSRALHGGPFSNSSMCWRGLPVYVVSTPVSSPRSCARSQRTRRPSWPSSWRPGSCRPSSRRR